METVSCPISGSAEFTAWLQVPDRFDTSGKVLWRLVRSDASGLVMLNPRPDSSEASLHYPAGSYDPHLHAQSSSSMRDRVYLAARSLLLSFRASMILHGAAKPLRRVSLLEIGCSTGDLLSYLHRKKGVPLDNLAGVETDAAAASCAREVCGLKVYPSLNDMKTGCREFDRIVLWHTLEHIHSLHETLALIEEKLKPDGILVMALPNPAGSDAEHYRENWIAWDAPRHLYHFMPGTLEKLLEPHKLELFRVQRYYPDTLYNTFYSEKLLCRRNGLPFHAVRSARAILRAAAYICQGMVRPAGASGLVYFARKKNTAIRDLKKRVKGSQPLTAAGEECRPSDLSS